MEIRGLAIFKTRCTMKISFMAGEDTVLDCIKAVKALFKQMKRIGNNKLFIALWYDYDKDTVNITNSS